MESVLHPKRPKCYLSAEAAQKANGSGIFIEFTLTALLETIEAQRKHKHGHKDEHRYEALSDTMTAVLTGLKDKNLSWRELLNAIGMKNDFRRFKLSGEPLTADGCIEMTVPDNT